MPNTYQGPVDAHRELISQREQRSSVERHIVSSAGTAHAMKGNREQYLSLGMDAYLSKPIDPCVLCAAVEAAVPGDARPQQNVTRAEAPVA
jgi:CheY-like chemotaxis protein